MTPPTLMEMLKADPKYGELGEVLEQLLDATGSVLDLLNHAEPWLPTEPWLATVNIPEPIDGLYDRVLQVLARDPAEVLAVT